MRQWLRLTKIIWKIFSGEEFTQQEKDSALRADCTDGSIVPVTMGSGLHVHGVYMLLDVITKYFPSPFFTKTGINVYDNELFDCIYDEKDFLAARYLRRYPTHILASIPL